MIELPDHQKMNSFEMMDYPTFEPYIRERPQRIVLSNDQVLVSSNKLSLETDSGYGSASSTSEKPPRSFDGERSQTSSQAFDNESSEAPTPIRSYSPELSIRSRTYTRKTVKIKVFDKDISESVQSRFKDLNEVFTQPLYSHLSKKRPLTSMISIKLKVLGTNENDAKPWIVVMCDKSISKRVKQFFDQSHVKSEYQPQDADQTLPFFEIVICNRPPRLLAANPRLNVYGGFRRRGLGKILRIGEPHEGRIATLGGVVLTESLDNEVHLFGMTTGHAVTKDFIDDIGALTSKSSCDKDGEEEDDDDCSLYSPEGCEEFELESACGDDGCVFSTNFVRDESSAAENGIFWQNIGSVFSTSDIFQIDGANLDWALIDMSDTTYRQAMIYGPAFGAKVLGHELAENESKKSVYFMGAVSGPGEGILSGTSSYLFLPPGTNFTRVYSLTLTSGTGKGFSRWTFLSSNILPTL